MVLWVLTIDYIFSVHCEIGHKYNLRDPVTVVLYFMEQTESQYWRLLMKLMKLLIIVDSSYVGYCQSVDTGVATEGTQWLRLNGKEGKGLIKLSSSCSYFQKIFDTHDMIHTLCAKVIFALGLPICWACGDQYQKLLSPPDFLMHCSWNTGLKES